MKKPKRIALGVVENAPPHPAPGPLMHVVHEFEFFFFLENPIREFDEKQQKLIQ